MAKHHGVIDNDLMWEFNDLTKSASLPVKYSNQYATDISKRAPYEVYNNQKHDTDEITDAKKESQNSKEIKKLTKQINKRYELALKQDKKLKQFFEGN